MPFLRRRRRESSQPSAELSPEQVTALCKTEHRDRVYLGGRAKATEPVKARMRDRGEHYSSDVPVLLAMDRECRVPAGDLMAQLHIANRLHTEHMAKRAKKLAAIAARFRNHHK
jgi:hypothetical protein